MCKSISVSIEVESVPVTDVARVTHPEASAFEPRSPGAYGLNSRTESVSFLHP
jgi:hypothetical protein